jgi:transcription elongation factor GreA
VTEQVISDPTVQEALSRYLRTLDGKPDVAEAVTRFGRWFGGERTMRSLRPADIERFGEETSKNPVDAARRLEAVRAFLTYAKKQSFTDSNLATHLRLRRTGATDNTNDTLGSDRIEMTAEGYAALESELTALQARRPEIAEELRMAMADKDFRENAPLDAAREKQAHIEARIRELEAILKRAVLVESGPEASGRARMGSRVRLRDLKSGRELQYTLVGPGEVNAGQGRISVQSPVGRAVVNRAAGDEVEVTAPAGVLRFRLEAVES